MADTFETVTMSADPLPADHPSRRFSDSLYLRAARCEPTERVPVWFQRQAGRSLPEYRALRGPLYLGRPAASRPSACPCGSSGRPAARCLIRALRGHGSILDAIADPATAAEITLQPVRRYGVDAAVLFSDIVVPAAAVGFGIDVVPGVGPVVAEPLRSRIDLDRLPSSIPKHTLPMCSRRCGCWQPSSMYRSSASLGRRSRWRVTSSKAARPASTP